MQMVRKATLLPLSQDPSTVKDVANTPGDDFCGMGCVPFPSMSNIGLENGFWCRGCERTFGIYRSNKLDQSIVLGLVPSGSDPFRLIMGM
jgi:hypothetical protein